MTVVLDTNIYISALVFGGPPRQILELAEKNKFQLFVSKPIQNEIKRVLTVKFDWSRKAITTACNPLWAFSQIVTPKTRITIITDDPTDNRILECAIAARAHIIVSGDKHLLRLKQYENIEIMRARNFLELVK